MHQLEISRSTRVAYHDAHIISEEPESARRYAGHRQVQAEAFKAHGRRVWGEFEHFH